jgi:uncharacterized protein (DUF433 family)
MAMGRIQWQERIVITPNLHHGDLCIAGTRIPVATILGSLADGMTPEEIQEAYPQPNQNSHRRNATGHSHPACEDLTFTGVNSERV